MNIFEKIKNIEQKAADLGFCWPDASMILDSIQSECTEVREVLENNESRARLEEEVGDLLFAAISLCFFEKLDPEATLNAATDKFTKRFKAVVRIAKKEGHKSLHGQPISKLVSLWDQAKQETK